MEMKEFYYQDGIRVSLFNVDHKAVPFHHHEQVFDMIHCSKGSIRIELPELQEIYHVKQGNVFQIPSAVKHRFANGESEGNDSRYVLLQIGTFDIHFVKDTESMQNKLHDVKVQEVDNGNIYIENRRDDIIRLANEFEANKPDVLTDEEQQDVVTALRIFAEQGIPERFKKSA